jgi:hypothetical protein
MSPIAAITLIRLLHSLRSQTPYGDIQSMKRSTKLASVAALAMVAAGSTSAFAGHNNGMGMKSFHHHHRHHLQLYFGGGGCGYYYDRWLDTGRFYWKRKFYICKGWW